VRLESPPDRSLELHVVRYQFPGRVAGSTPFSYDANWLMIDVAVADGSLAWRFGDPALLTTEVRSLAAWFEGVATHQIDADEIRFTEPVLSFRTIAVPGDEIGIRVSFELEGRPPAHRRDEWGSFGIDFAVSAEQLLQASEDLRADLMRFPVQGVEQRS
jgi:hypothetical protein